MQVILDLQLQPFNLCLPHHLTIFSSSACVSLPLLIRTLIVLDYGIGSPDSSMTSSPPVARVTTLFPNKVPFWGVKVLLAQSCPTLCDPMDCSPSGSSVPGKNTGVVAIPFSREFSWRRDWTQVSCVAGKVFSTGPPGMFRAINWKII